MWKRFAIVVAFAYPLLIGCQSDRLSPPDASFLRASIEGAVVHEFEGPGEFAFGTTPGGERTFGMWATVEDNGTWESFSIRRWSKGRPGVGRHPIALVQRYDPDDLRIASGYSHGDEDGYDSYRAYEGTVDITRSTRSVVEGSFTMSAYRACRHEVTDEGFMHPTEQYDCQHMARAVPSGAPEIRVTGSFRATRGSMEVRPSLP